MSDVEQIAALIDRARDYDKQAEQQLNEALGPGIRKLLSRSFDPEHADALVAGILNDLVHKIRSDGVNDTQSLLAFVRERVRERISSLNPKPSAPVSQPGDLPSHRLAGMSKQDREIMVRYYTLVQDERRISTEMGLPEETVHAALAEARRRYREPTRASREPDPRRRTSRAC